MSRRLLVPLLSLSVLAAACNGPLLLLPGGRLEGPTAPVPADWTLLGDVSTVQLETGTSEPYSVNIWAVGAGPHVYVHAGANRATWIENMEREPEVRLRVEGTIYELRAVRVEDQAEFDRFAELYEQKYGSRPRNESVVEAYLFRLGAG